MGLVWECERRFPVADWRVGEIHAWPLIRKNLAENLRTLPAEAAARGQLSRALRGALEQQRAAALDCRRNARVRESDVLFLSNASCRSVVNARWMDRLCDPVRERLELMGHHCLHLELAAQEQYRIPRWRNSKYMQQAVMWQHLGNILRPRQWEDREVELAGFEDLLDYVKQDIYPEWRFSRAILLQSCSLLEKLALTFGRILGATQARLVFVMCYYGLTGLAAIHAARQRQILSVDLQHGVQGELHFAYGPWTNCPREGFTLLPDRFWCWSEADAGQINSWATVTAPRHSAFAGGNPWASYWHYSNAAGAADVRERLRAVRQRLGGSRQILISLQWGADAASPLPPEIARCIARAPEDWRWWIRFHPSDALAMHSSTGRGTGLPQERIEWQAANTLPLPLLLPAMDAHLTRSSSVVQEAAAVGVPSVVTHATGSEYYCADIAAGTVRYASQSDEITNALKELTQARSGSAGPGQALDWDVSLRRLGESTGPVF